MGEDQNSLTSSLSSSSSAVVAAAVLSSKRAKARWSILRQALLSANNNNNNNTRACSHEINSNSNNGTTITTSNSTNDDEDEDDVTRYSIHKFPGFQMISRQVVVEQEGEGEEILIMAKNHHGHCEKGYDYHDIVRYEIPFPRFIHHYDKGQEKKEEGDVNHNLNNNNNGQRSTEEGEEAIVFYTLEPPTPLPSTRGQRYKKKIDIKKDLMSHVHYGVDNTGNTRVWDCSNVLAFLLTMKSHVEEEAVDKEANNKIEKVNEKEKISGTVMDKGEDDRDKESHGGSLVFSKHKKPMIGLDNILKLAKHRRRCKKQRQQKQKQQQLEQDVIDRKTLRVLELGAGMAALPSLALAVLGSYFKKWNDEQQMQRHKQQCGDESCGMVQYPEIHVTITDGHPKAVANNVACIKRTMSQWRNDEDDDVDNNDDTMDFIHCCPLLWKRNEQGRKECQELLCKTISMLNHDDDDHGNNKNENQPPPQKNDQNDGFDLILVSDCLHFTNFHVDLAMTIGRLLRVGGVCILCQPARGTSIHLFLQLIHAMNGQEEPSLQLFEVNLYKQYHPGLYEKHVHLMMNEKNEHYIPDIHYPLWLELKKVGNYCEDLHGGRAMGYENRPHVSAVRN